MIQRLSEEKMEYSITCKSRNVTLNMNEAEYRNNHYIEEVGAARIITFSCPRCNFSELIKKEKRW